MANSQRLNRFVAKLAQNKALSKLLGAFAPFAPLMRNQLAIRGISVDANASLFFLVLVFAQRVVGGRAGQKAAEILDLIETGRDSFDGQIYVADIAAATIAAIATVISAVATFIRELKKRADRGELAPEQAMYVNQADDILDAANRGLNTLGLPGSGDLMPIILFALAAYFILK